MNISGEDLCLRSRDTVATMGGLRAVFERVFRRDRSSRSVPDGGVVDADGSGDRDERGTEPDGPRVETHAVTDERGVDRAETLSGAGFRQIFDATGVPTFVLDAAGNVAEWNDSIAELTGASREDAVGHGHASELFYPDGRRADTLADKVLDAPTTADAVHGVERVDAGSVDRYRDTSTMVDRHGEEKHIEFTATPLYDGDELVGVTEVVIDRTENVNERDATAALVSEIRETAEAIGEGDLDARAVCREECATLDDDLIRVIGVVNDMAETIDTLSSGVHDQARTLDETVREAGDAAAEIAENVDEQNELLEESVSEMQSFSAGMEEVAATADEVDSAATAASDAAAAGLDASEDAREATEDVVEIGDELVESVGALSDRMDDIEEVKSLADETRGYTEEITESLAELQAQSDETSAAVERSHERIADAGTEIETVLDSLEEIADAVDEAAAGVAEVARTTDDQAATVEELTSSLEAVRERSDRTEAATDRIVDATADQEAAVDELITRVEQLDAR